MRAGHVALPQRESVLHIRLRSAAVQVESRTEQSRAEQSRAEQLLSITVCSQIVMPSIHYSCPGSILCTVDAVHLYMCDIKYGSSAQYFYFVLPSVLNSNDHDVRRERARETL